ncbi:MAG TPA: hypothetical protein VKV40_05095 [Ktedonobacteraceae bacterium]|nr:hypothetical protein [Ktedonobacteraceae bacterium]
MRTLNIALMVLRAGVLIELVLGILFWTNVINPDTSKLVLVHILIGLIVVVSLWIIGLAQGFIRASNNFGLALLTFVVGLVVALFGLLQTRMIPDSSAHWVIQVIHLALGLLAIATGEMVAAVTKRRVRAAKADTTLRPSPTTTSR